MNKKTLLNILKKIRLGSLIIALIVAIASIVIIIDATFFFKIFDIGVADSIISLTLIFDIIVVIEYIVIQYLTMYIDGLIEKKMDSTSEDTNDTEDEDEIENDEDAEYDAEDNDYDFGDMDYESIPMKDLIKNDNKMGKKKVEKREDESGKFDPSEMTVMFTSLNGTEYKIYGPRNDYRVENLRTNRVVGYYSNGIKYITYTGKCGSASLNVKKYWHELTGREIE